MRAGGAQPVQCSPAENPLVAHILNVNGVHNLGAVKLDGLVHPIGFHTRQHGELLLNDGPHCRGVGQALR